MAAEGSDQGIEECRSAALEAARCPDAGQFAHEQTQIRPADLHEQSLEHVGMAAQMHAPQSSRFVEMGVGTFEPFAALTQQAPPAGASNASPVGVDGRPGRGLSPPATPAPVRLGHVAADAQRGQRHQGLVAVVPLIAHHLGEAKASGNPHSLRVRSAPPSDTRRATVVPSPARRERPSVTRETPVP